jgi:hypothetical protein
LNERECSPMGNWQPCPPSSNIVRFRVVFGNCMARRRLAAAGVELDLSERTHTVLARSAMPARIAGIVATEFSILYQALAAWRRPAFAPAQSRAFSYHRENGLLGILYAILGSAIVELAALEFLLRARHHVAANVFLCATMGQTNVLATLTGPLVAVGAYGTTRTVTRVGSSVDDPNTFSLALAATAA